MTHSIWRDASDITRDPDERMAELLAWHLGDATGSPYWTSVVKPALRRKIPQLGVAGLAELPLLHRDLARLDVRDLVPRALINEPIHGVFESGGTTGVPKRVIVHEAWTRLFVEHSVETMTDYGFPRDAQWLAAVPTGPHVVGAMVNRGARAMGGVVHGVDIDPRWPKIASAPTRATYVDHIVGQVSNTLLTQDIDVLVTTPALLLELAQRPGLIERLRNLTALRWGGTHFAPHDRYHVMTELLPEVRVYGSYGNTLTLGYAAEQADHNPAQPAAFEPFAPFTSFRVVEDGELSAPGVDVALGSRGRVVVSHVSPGFLLPRVIERDRATRIGDIPGSHVVADIAPLRTVGGSEIVEGVY